MIDVLIVGAGAAGLTLACDLQRRGVSHRIVDASPRGFEGSRAKGLQPRTLEVFDDLGVLERVRRRSAHYPLLGVHVGPLAVPWPMIRRRKVTPDVPHPDTLLTPQYATDLSLRERLEELGGRVEGGVRLAGLSQDDDGVTAELAHADGGAETVRARYLVGADGGSSTVRRGLGIAFEGTTDESERMLIADVDLDGLSRNRWHVWPRLSGRFVGACPLPDGPFQVMITLREGDPAAFDEDGARELASGILGQAGAQVRAVRWSSVWRPNIRLAGRYRSGRVLLVGDACHVHPPTGAQGLNTGVQDAYNLGWKLGQVLAGAPDALLDTYEAERRPIAAGVLGLATELYGSFGKRSPAAARRGEDERQLGVSYRGGPLAHEVPDRARGVQAGDRAPDSPIVDASGARSTVFDTLRGPHFTVLAIGSAAVEAACGLDLRTRGAEARVAVLDASANTTWRRLYGIDGDGIVVIRPDGYVGDVIDKDFDSFAAGLMPGLVSVATAPGAGTR